MGVLGLWDLLAPVGRRVSVETLAGKKLAIDASIWMVQFTKAMRDEKGEMVRNAHLVGFFRRICKLLFLRTRPVFVFDGGTPALKRRTVAARRRHRENARAKIRKTAEKLLINHLKSRRLEELAEEIKRVNEEKNDPKGKRVVAEDSEILKASSADKQKVLDELLAASLAVEEEEGLMVGEASSAAGVVEEGTDDDDTEELMFPVIHGNVDPNVLASLPPSIQLDLLVQMRERLMAENRQKYQKIKKVPTKFSELQIQSYLKTVAFRREIDEVQKVASGRGLGGVQTSRIASEANREFIFSSSFSGNKQALTSLAATRVSNKMQPGTLTKESDGAGRSINSSIVQLSHVSQSAAKEPATNFDSDIETYCDERGRFRVSRNRALGIRMTRDLERNLELMKEHEKEHHAREGSADASRSCSGDFSVNITGANASSVQSPYISGNDSTMEISFLDDGQDAMDDRLFSHLVAGSPITGFSSENTWFGKCSKDVLCEEGFGIEKKDQLNTSDHTKIHLSSAEEDVDWEEGINIEKKDQVNTSNHTTIHLSSDEEAVDWEDGNFRSFQMVSQEKTQNKYTLPKGLLEEQAEIQEAIRRSLEDVRHRHLEDSIYQSLAMKNNGSSNAFSPQMGTVERYQLDQTVHEDALQADADVAEDLKSSKHIVSPVAGIKDNQDALESRDTSSNLESFRYIGARDNISNHSIEVPNKTFVDDSQQRQGFRNCRKELAEASSRAYADSTCKLQNVDNIDSCMGNQNDMSMKEGIDQNIYTTANKMTETFQSPIGITNQDEIVTEDLQIAKDKAMCAETQKENPQSNFEVDQLESLKEDAELPSLDEEISRLRLEGENLRDEQRRHEINSDTVSSEMFAECQELLQMFGLPYIIAPMEAEAQCAHMELVNLVDGVVTDDSDVFLFGARSVYKNIFDDRKYVETYFMKDMETELGLTCEKLIRMALLLGSDYTEGVSGIGIVNAIEVVNAFPEEDGLQKFRDWLESPDPDILEKVGPQTGVNSKKRSKGAISCENKLEKKFETNADNFDGASLPIADSLSESKMIFMSKHRNVSKNWHVPSSFPSLSVISAYSSPQVDESTESFSWGKPDLLLLRKLCWERFGWSNQKADELLLPVLKEYNKHETQLRLEAFYSFNERFAKIRSQRIKKAVKGITGRLSAGLLGEPAQDSPNSQEKASCLLKPTVVGGQTECTRTDAESGRSDLQTKHLAKGNVEGRGRGARGRGRGKRKVTGDRNGRGRAGGRGAKPNHNPPESDLSDRDDDISENQDKVSQVAPELRMSARQRKTVKYTEESSEDGDDVSAGLLDTSESKAVDQAAKIIVADIESLDTLGIPDQSSMETAGHLDDRMPKEYLFNGGGFCADEDGVNPAYGLKEAIPASLPASTSSDADFIAGMEGSSGSQFKENSEEPAQMDEQGLASGMGGMYSGLRAMPMLRRKRRKTQ